MRLRLSFAAALIAAQPALAAEDGPGPNLEITVAGQADDCTTVIYGTIVIDLLPDVAPQHVERITTLAKEGAYDGVVFHRVIEGYMAQTGDVQFGKSCSDLRRAGFGVSSYPDLDAEFSDLPFFRGTVGMARSEHPNSANSQFFIVFNRSAFLEREYTVVGRVIEGMMVTEMIQRGEWPNGAVIGAPAVMQTVTVVE